MINNEPKTIPGAIAIAFSTRRKQFLTMGLAELRKNAAEGPPSQEEYERVLNALEMATTELWEMQDCTAAMNGRPVMNIEILLEVASALVEEPGTNPEYERAVIEVIDRVCEKMDVSRGITDARWAGDHVFGIETPGKIRRAWIRMQLGWTVDKAAALAEF